jgi:hypothetical protein
MSVLLSSFAAAQDVDVPGNLTMVNSCATAGNILKDGVPFIHNFGPDNSNTFVGLGTGNFTIGGEGIQGRFNTAVGASALQANSTGFVNTASGNNALFSNTTGGGNTASGVDALYSNTSGSNNTASGRGVLYSNTSGSGNTASGELTLQLNTTGSFNTAIGDGALSGNTTGNNNTAVGTGANVSAGNFNNAAAIGGGALVNASNKIRLGDTNVTVIEGQGDFHSSGAGNGVILKSPDGLTCARLSIDNSGQLVTTPLACP